MAHTQRDPASVPDAPSPIDRLMAAVERLPLPYWFTYLILGLAELAVLHVVAWTDGVVPFPATQPILLSLVIWLWGSLAVMFGRC